MRRALLLALALGPGPAAAAPRARPCGELQLLLPAGAPSALDPALPQGAADLLATRALHAGLLEPGAGGVLQPALAEELPQVSPDGRLVRIRLRAGLRFHDGAPITAADAVESLSRLLRPELRSPHGYLAAPIEGADEVRAGRARVPAGLTAPSPLELAIRLSEPAPSFLRGLATPPAAVVHATTLAGAGPFRPVSRAPDGLRLTAFAGHFRGRPWCEGLALHGPDAAAAARRLARGGSDLALRPEAFPGLAPQELPLLTAVVVQVRAQRLGPSAEPVRRALAALDRTELARLLRGPSRAMSSLDTTAAAPPAAPPPAHPAPPLPQRLGLLAPASLRALADRLQVKLFDRGVRVAVEAVPDAAFPARLEAGLHELALLPTTLAGDDGALALAQLAAALGGAARGDQALRDAARLGLAAAAASVESDLAAVPLALSWLRASASPGLQGFAPSPDGTFDPGALWLLPSGREGRPGP